MGENHLQNYKRYIITLIISSDYYYIDSVDLLRIVHNVVKVT